MVADVAGGQAACFNGEGTTCSAAAHRVIFGDCHDLEEAPLLSAAVARYT